MRRTTLAANLMWKWRLPPVANRHSKAASTWPYLQDIEPEIKPAQRLRLHNIGQIRVNSVQMLSISGL
ncbi:MAG: hypothetical protein ACRYGO_15750 [Janthinobacterium lividum]